MTERRRAERQDDTFARIVAAAVAGERCPTTDQGLSSANVSALAHAGRIAVEVSTHNWRRVTILEGEHAGKSTAANPLKKFSTYLTLDKRGTLRNGKHVNYGGYRTQPSKPRLLSRDQP